MDTALKVFGDAERPLVYAKKVEVLYIPDPAKMSVEETREIRGTIKRNLLKLI